MVNTPSLRYFSPTNNEGYLPVGTPVEGPGRLLYVTTYFGRLDDGGTIYSVKKDGSGLVFLYRFSWDLPDGAEPDGEMIRGNNGALYGTSCLGGGPINGSVFRIKPVALEGAWAGGDFVLRSDGFAGQSYALEAADSLLSGWSEIATVTNPTGAVDWTDTAPDADSRFYQAQVLNP